MDYFLPDISEEFSKPFLPPIFGASKQKHKKKRSKNQKPKKPKPKILYDTNLRSKASSVICSAPPNFLKSKYRTSRLTQLSNYSYTDKPIKALRSNSNLSTLANINRSQRFSLDHSPKVSYEDSKFYMRSEFRLPSINKSAVFSVENGFQLMGNKKEIIVKADYFKANEEKKKECKEIALGTDLITEIDNDDPIEQYFDDRDRINMRRSSFDSRLD